MVLHIILIVSNSIFAKCKINVKKIIVIQDMQLLKNIFNLFFEIRIY
jgi:hypothetical protein